ncbi:MAG: hypothetical protein GF411_03210 [Candidatus Lokiarchaeota archaeon]|nr:hypothetical protein [Candidatus Lokiarchaeota archaeon]
MTACGKKACICLYRTEECYFCDVARELLIHAIENTGFTGITYMELDIDKTSEYAIQNGNLAIPTISICDTILTGIPDMDSLSTALNRYLHKDCFLEV